MCLPFSNLIVTMLIVSAMWGHLQAVELLVNSDADIELCDNEGKTAVSYYIHYSNHIICMEAYYIIHLISIAQTCHF